MYPINWAISVCAKLSAMKFLVTLIALALFILACMAETTEQQQPDVQEDEPQVTNFSNCYSSKCIQPLVIVCFFCQKRRDQKTMKSFLKHSNFRPWTSVFPIPVGVRSESNTSNRVKCLCWPHAVSCQMDLVDFTATQDAHLAWISRTINCNTDNRRDAHKLP